MILKTKKCRQRLVVRAVFLCCALLLGWAPWGLAGTAYLQPEVEDLWLAEYADVLRAVEPAQDSLDYVRSPQGQREFQPRASDNISIGADLTPHWFRVELHNPSELAVRRELLAGSVYLDYQAYLVFPETGAWIALKPHQRAKWQTLFTMDIPPQTNATLYFRSQARNLHITSPWLRLVSSKLYDQELEIAHGASALFYGFLVGMLLFSLGTYATSRVSDLLYYSAWIATALPLLMTEDGTSLLLLWSLEDETFFVFRLVALNCIAFMLLTIKLLQINPKWLVYRAMQLVIGVMALGFLGSFWFSFNFGDPAYLLMILSYLLVGIAAIRSLKTRRQEAVLFLWSWSGVILTTLYLMVQMLSGTAYTAAGYWWTNAVFKGATLVQLVLLGHMFSRRLRAELAQRMEAERLAAIAAERRNAELESQIQKRTEVLTEVNLSKDRLFSIVAQGLRGPLGELSEYCEQLRLESGADYKRLLAQLQQAASHTQDTTADLLAWAISQLDDLGARQGPCELSADLNQLAQRYRRKAQFKGQQLQVDLPHKVLVDADGSALLVILRNLLDNAIKFTPEKGTIRLAVVSRGADWEFSVQDTGPGINAEQIRCLVSQGLPAETKQFSEGSGVGLRLCMDLIERLGSRLQVESQMGQGAHFWFDVASADNGTFLEDPRNASFQAATGFGSGL